MTSDSPEPSEEELAERPVIRDKRRVDPETGKLREPQEAAAPQSPGPEAGSADASDSPGAADQGQPGAPEPSDLEKQLAERTADLQRLQAEYVNYRRRVDRDRETIRQNAIASTLTELLPVLDDIDRAREHDELHGGFKAVAGSFERTVGSLGLERFGEVGDPFDPRVHDALSHRHSDDVDGAVCEAILQVGYRVGERLIRPARVAVVESTGADAGTTDSPDDSADPSGADTSGADTSGADTSGADPSGVDTADTADTNAAEGTTETGPTDVPAEGDDSQET